MKKTYRELETENYILKRELNKFTDVSNEKGVLFEEVITKKIEVEQKLIASLEKYRLLVENSVAAILIADCDGKYHYANTVAGRNVNMSPEEVVGKSVYDFFPKKQAGILIADTRDAIRNKKRIEKVNLTQIGHRFRWLKTIVEPLESGSDNDKVMVISYDIDEEKTQNIKIEELNRRLKVLSRIDRAIIKHLDSKDDFFQVVLSQIYSLIPGDIISFAALNCEEETVTIEALLIKGKSEDRDHFKINFNDLNLRLIEDESPVILQLKKNEIKSGFQRFLYQNKIRSYLVLPIFYDKKPAGALLLFSEKISFFTAGHLAIIDEISQQLTIGYRQMLLNSQIKLQYENLEKIVEKRTQEIDRISGLNNSIVSTTSSVIFLLNPDGTVLTMNPIAEEILGYQINEVVNRKKIQDLFCNETYQIIQNKIEQEEGLTFHSDGEILSYLANSIKEPVELIFLAKNRTPIPVMMSVNSISDKNGQIIHYAVVAIDITEKKKSEQALWKSNQIKQGLLNTFPDLLFYLDKEGTYKDIFTLHDEKLFAPREIFLGKKIEEILPRGLAVTSMQYLKKALQTKETIIYNYSLVINNVKSYFENRIVAISNDEALSIVRDITDTKLAEIYGHHQRKMGFKLASATKPAEAIKLVIKYLIKPEEISAAGFFLYNAETKRFILADYSGISEESARNLQEITSGFSVGHLLHQKKYIIKTVEKVVNAPDIFKDENISQAGYKPITYGKKLIGILAFGSPSTEKFNDILLTHLGLIANQMSGALYRIYTQQQLISSQKNFRLLFETIDDFLFILDNKGNMIEFNTSVEKKLGYSGEELYGRDATMLNPPERREEARLRLKEILAGQRDVCTIPLYTKNGESVPVETKVALGKWNGHDALFALARDITQRLKFEEQLKKSEARWQFALESSGDGIWDKDFKTGRVFYSGHWKKMLGYSEDEISDRSDEWQKRIHPEDFDRVMRDMDLHIKGKTELYSNEHRLLCKDRQYKWVLGRGKVISRDKNGNPERMIGTSIDISARKNTENSLVLALQKEKELNELKSQFVSMASHEFRTPLAIMMMASESLEANWDKMSNKDRIKKIHRLKNNIVFLGNIIEKTLNLSRLESGKIKFLRAKENLNLLVQSVIEKVSESFNNNHEIIFRGTSVPAVLHIDKQMIDEVISNLLTNSFKYSDPGTEIDVVIKKSEKGFKIDITDRGIGIPEDLQKNIYDAFWRGSNVKNIHGTGLGLPISRKFVQMHGGDISFISEVNKGTTFTVYLPTKKFG